MGVYYTFLGLLAGLLVAVVFPWALLRTLAKEDDASEEKK
jgi:hypothetical protein|tara:strand:+ start:529 stop:648 length:120 start_codon:yes stop_codon:yes gene_type:complete